jgi:hypothetical protein
MVADMGLGWAIVQFQDVHEDELDSCFWVTLFTTGIAYVLLYVLAPIIARWFDSPQLSDVMRFASAPLLFCAVGLVPGAMLVKHLQLDKTAQADFISTLVSMPVMLVLAWNGAGVWALVFGGITQAVVRTVAVITFYPWWAPFHFTWRRISANLGWSLYSLGSMGPSVCGIFTALIVLAVTTIVGAVVYVSAVSLMRRPLAKEIWEVLQWILGRKRTVRLSDVAAGQEGDMVKDFGLG